jgi:hypothetical protein
MSVRFVLREGVPGAAGGWMLLKLRKQIPPSTCKVWAPYGMSINSIAVVKAVSGGSLKSVMMAVETPSR